MAHLTLTAGQVQQLNTGSSSLVECCDSTGNLVGYLHIAGRNGAFPIPDISPEKLGEYEREPGERHLADIIRDLRRPL